MRLSGFSDELRLLWTVLLNGGLFLIALRFARRQASGGFLQATCDSFLIYFVVQYVAVGVTGAIGVFNEWSMTLIAVVASAALWILSRTRQTLEGSTGATSLSGDHLGPIACALFAVTFIALQIFNQRPLPPVATDALVYHLPTAVQWMQTHRLGIYPSWYWNPAASYSPATGSTFMAWWMVPAGNDVFVRFVQAPPLIFIFFLTARIARLLGASRLIAGLIAIGVTLSRPLFSEATIAKDDLYVTSFIAAAIVALANADMRARTGPCWRVGLALGMVLASKYTALLACPIFLFMVDAPFRSRWRWKQWCVAITTVLVLAMPWYVRNLVLTGNPLFPVDVNVAGLHWRGLFGTERDQQLRTAAGVWKMLATTYHSLPTPMIVLLGIGWLWTVLSGRRTLLRDPLARACVIGSVMTIVVFLVTSPHHEIRYLFPLIVVLLAGFALGIRRITWPPLRIASAAILAIASVATSFDAELLQHIAKLTSASLGVAAAITCLIWLQISTLHLSRSRIAWICTAIVALVAMVAYTQWGAYVESYRDSRFVAWSQPNSYPRQATIWGRVDEHVPADATLAYANTFFVYPYYGFNFTRHVIYAPVRRGLHDFRDFPRMGDRVPGDLLVRRMTQVMNEDADFATWMENLRRSGATYLVVMKPDPGNPDLDVDPPELRFARSAPQIFEAIYDDPAGTIFQIR